MYDNTRKREHMKNFNEKRILLADDVASIREALKACLLNLGFKSITIAIDGRDAWEKLKNLAKEGTPAEIIFSDINMPNCHGIDLVKLIRNSDDYKETPVIMISTENETEIIMDAIEAGANNYILKPFNPATIKEKLNEIARKENL